MKIRLAFSLPAFETAELAAAVETWCELLFDAVPPDRLNDCYLYAVKHRDSTFPLAVTELLTAWREIREGESREATRKRHCYVCNGSGWGMVYDPKTDTESMKQCGFCLGDIPTDLELVTPRDGAQR